MGSPIISRSQSGAMEKPREALTLPRGSRKAFWRIPERGAECARLKGGLAKDQERRKCLAHTRNQSGRLVLLRGRLGSCAGPALTPLSLGASLLPSPGISLLSDRGLEPDGLPASWLSRAPRSLWRGLARGGGEAPAHRILFAAKSLPLPPFHQFPQVMPETPGLAAESSSNYSHLENSVLRLLITKPCSPNYMSKEASQEPPSWGQPTSCSPRPTRSGGAGWQLLPGLHSSLRARPCRKRCFRGLPWNGHEVKGGRGSAPKSGACDPGRARGRRPPHTQRVCWPDHRTSQSLSRGRRLVNV